MSNEDILKIILDRLLKFFINDGNIQLNKTNLLTNVDSYVFNKYTSSIDITGDINRTIIFSFSEELIEKFTKEFVPSGYSNSETIDMVDNIPSEMANNILGLALKSFPKGGLNINISTPKVYSEEELLLMSINSLNSAVKVQTQSGDIMCYIKCNKDCDIKCDKKDGKC